MARHRSLVTAARRVVDVAIIALILLVASGVVLGRAVRSGNGDDDDEDIYAS